MERHRITVWNGTGASETHVSHSFTAAKNWVAATFADPQNLYGRIENAAGVVVAIKEHGKKGWSKVVSRRTGTEAPIETPLGEQIDGGNDEY